MKPLSFLAALALCALCSLQTGYAQDKPRPHTLSLDELPRVQTWQNTDARPDTLHKTDTSSFVLRVQRNLPAHYTPIGDAHNYALVTLLKAPGDEDEPGVFVTSENFTRNASSFEVLSGGVWHKASLLYSNKELGLSALHVELPADHPQTPRTLRTDKAPVLQPTTILFDAKRQPKSSPATLGARGQGVLGFFHGVTPSLPPGTPLFDKEHNIIAIVALNLPQRAPQSWALHTEPILKFLQEVTSPILRDAPKDNITRVTLEPR